MLKPALRYRWLATLAWAVLSLVTSSLAFASISHRTASPFPDRAEHAAQYNATGNQRDHHFTGNPTPAGRVGARDVGKAAAARRWVGASPHLGMPKELIDGAGNLAWAAAHSAYGAAIATQGPEDVEVDGGFVQSDGPRVESPFRLLGQVNDEDAELAWTRFRCFDADTGTWISTDPLGLAGGLALYGFDGSPSDVVDPFGLSTSGGGPHKGQKLYRVYGGDSQAGGASWSPVDPRTVPDYRDAAGLPSGGESGANNTGRFVIEGTLQDPSAVVLTRPALPLDGKVGGLEEYIIPKWRDTGAVQVDRVSGASPEF